MNKIFKFVLAFIGLLVVLFIVNLLLAAVYFIKYQDEIRATTNSFIDAMLKEDLQRTYQMLSDDRKESLSYDEYAKTIQNLKVPKDKSCEIKGLRVNSVMSTSYFGPEAIVTISCLDEDGKNTSTRRTFLKKGNTWKIAG